jgi:hypothetical protein
VGEQAGSRWHLRAGPAYLLRRPAQPELWRTSRALRVSVVRAVTATHGSTSLASLDRGMAESMNV